MPPPSTPQATSQTPGGSTTTLKIGKSVVYNERIATSESGVVQVLLLDGSNFTVGPGSDLVIDKFVYNPRTGSGELAAGFSKGALRFVGSKLSKSERGVKVKTPAGRLTVRGGIFQGIVRNSNQAVFAFVYGHHLSLSRGGRRYTLNQSGNLFAIG
ncbi:MAG TPA: FecR domain-containing protein, partial [Thermoguttaceae bacterium]|nr:FecR domain-containing protein [Thermoguttaceae bacterium]